MEDSNTGDVFDWQGSLKIDTKMLTAGSSWQYQSNMPSIVLSPNTYSNLNWNGTGDNTFDWNYNDVKNTKDEIKGISSRLDKIEERLAILKPNTELEDKWEELKKLGEQYRLLEQELTEKQKIWDLLNK